jgi:hypothetical protein
VVSIAGRRCFAAPPKLCRYFASEGVGEYEEREVIVERFVERREFGHDDAQGRSGGGEGREGEEDGRGAGVYQQ